MAAQFYIISQVALIQYAHTMVFTVGLNTFLKVSTNKQCCTELGFKQWILVLK